MKIVKGILIFFAVYVIAVVVVGMILQNQEWRKPRGDYFRTTVLVTDDRVKGYDLIWTETAYGVHIIKRYLVNAETVIENLGWFIREK